VAMHGLGSGDWSERGSGGAAAGQRRRRRRLGSGGGGADWAVETVVKMKGFDVNLEL